MVSFVIWVICTHYYKERNASECMREQRRAWNKAILGAAVADGCALVLAVLSMFVEVSAVVPSVLVGAVYYGYVRIAQKKKLRLLQGVSWAGVLLSVAAIAMFAFFESRMRIMLLFMAYGIVGVLVGICLVQLWKEFKALCVLLSFLLILTNGVYAVILLWPNLSPVGFYLSMPTAIAEIIFLVMAAKKI